MIQESKSIFWVKTLMFSHKTQKKCLRNPNDNLKNRYYFKLILGHAAFQLLSKWTFSLKFSLLLNNYLIKAKGKYKQVIKLWISVDYYFISDAMMLISIEVVHSEDNFPFFFL